MAQKLSIKKIFRRLKDAYCSVYILDTVVLDPEGWFGTDTAPGAELLDLVSAGTDRR